MNKQYRVLAPDLFAPLRFFDNLLYDGFHPPMNESGSGYGGVMPQHRVLPSELFSPLHMFDHFLVAGFHLPTVSDDKGPGYLAKISAKMENAATYIDNNRFTRPIVTATSWLYGFERKLD